jgi:hypothetical protein
VARPHKGERRPITLRLPIDLSRRIDQLQLPDRHAWIVDGIRERLNKTEGIGHGVEA